MKITPDEFWEITWYDWSLYLFRLKEEQDKMHLLEEVRWVPWRELYALLCNINRDAKKKPTPFKGTDFLKLSFDGTKEQIQPNIPDDDLVQKLKKKYSK